MNSYFRGTYSVFSIEKGQFVFSQLDIQRLERPVAKVGIDDLRRAELDLDPVVETLGKRSRQIQADPLDEERRRTLRPGITRLHVARNLRKRRKNLLPRRRSGFQRVQLRAEIRNHRIRSRRMRRFRKDTKRHDHQNKRQKRRKKRLHEWNGCFFCRKIRNFILARQYAKIPKLPAGKKKTPPASAGLDTKCTRADSSSADGQRAIGNDSVRASR